MKINITGNPGTGNTFMEIHIQHVDNFWPAAIPAAINNKGLRAESQDVKPQDDSRQDQTQIRKEILAYVDRLCTSLADEWKSTYQKTWEDILDLEAVSSTVYRPGKQRGTNFNRNLVANIIHYLNGRGAYGKNYNAACFAESLEGDKNHSVRSALGRDPLSGIVSRLDRYFG